MKTRISIYVLLVSLMVFGYLQYSIAERAKWAYDIAHRIEFSQEQFWAWGYNDVDADGPGEYGHLSQLCGIDEAWSTIPNAPRYCNKIDLGFKPLPMRSIEKCDRGELMIYDPVNAWNLASALPYSFRDYINYRNATVEQRAGMLDIINKSEKKYLCFVWNGDQIIVINNLGTRTVANDNGIKQMQKIVEQYFNYN